MKSQTRALIVFLIVFILFSTPFIGPFRYFSELIARLAGAVIGLLPLPAAWAALSGAVFRALVLTALLLFGRSRQSHYIAAFCALAGMVHHLVTAIATRSLSAVSLPIAVGLALALLFLLLPSNRPSLWLSDAFTMGLSAGLIYDGVLGPVFSLLRLPSSALAPLFVLPDQSLINRLSGHLGLPALVWALLIAALAVLPVIFWGRGRQKG